MQETSMKNSFVKPQVEIGLSPIHRYGVFATRDILPKEIIEECPVILTHKKAFNYEQAPNQEELLDRVFIWQKDVMAIALGYGSVYNHSDVPNAEYICDHKNRIMQFAAIKPISVGEEIFIEYNNDRWFVHTKKIPAVQETSSSFDEAGKIVKFVFTEPLKAGEECFVDYTNKETIFIRDRGKIKRWTWRKSDNFSRIKLFILFSIILVLSLIFPLHS